MFKETVTDFDRLMEVMKALDTLGVLYIVHKIGHKNNLTGRTRIEWIVLQVAQAT